MAENAYVADIAKHEGQEVTLHGWLHNRAPPGKLHFLQVRDGTGIIQCVVFKGNVTPEVFTEADHLPQETSIAVTAASSRRTRRSPIGYELDVRGPDRASPGRRRSSRSATRSTASPSSWSSATSGCAPRGRT